MKNVLYTIGYEGVTIDVLIECLKKENIKNILDVRAVPLSRKPGFSKTKFADTLAVHGIRYYGLKGLGTPAAGREAARKGRHREMRLIFLKQMETQLAQKDMNQAITLALAARSCLLCFENNPGHCHRLIVAGKMAERADFAISHLNPVSSGSFTGDLFS